MAKGKSKSWPKIGTLRKSDKGYYIKLDEGVSISLNGEDVALNESRTVRLEDPRVKLDQLFERGIIDEKTHSERQEKLAEMDWLRQELIVPPPRN